MIEQKNTDKDISIMWQEIKDNLKFRLGESIYNNWLSKIEFVEKIDNHIVLSASSKFIADWVNDNYKEIIEKLFRYYLPELEVIDIIVNTTSSLQDSPVASDNKFNYIDGAKHVIPQHVNGKLIESYSSSVDERFTFDNFVIGNSNQLAYEAARSVAELDKLDKVKPFSNPLFIYGRVGLGKTHLMHAIANHIKNNDSNRKVVYLSAEKFMYEFVKALRNKDIMNFKEQFRSVDMLMIDDVQFICGKDSTQEEFFHTFNALIDSNKQIVLSCDRSPTDLDDIEDRVKSRLGWGLVIDIHSTDYELRLGILYAKCEQLNLDLSSEVIELLASRINTNVRELEGALNKVIAYSNYMHKKIDTNLVQTILRDLFRASDKSASIEEIQKYVAEFYNIKFTDMSSSKRLRSVARPRQIAMYLSKTLTVKSLNEIGKKFGGKDHTTVLHAVKTIEKMLESDKELQGDLTILSSKLQ